MLYSVASADFSKPVAGFELCAFLGKVCINLSNMDITGHLPAIRFVANYLLGAGGSEPQWSLLEAFRKPDLWFS